MVKLTRTQASRLGWWGLALVLSTVALVGSVVGGHWATAQQDLAAPSLKVTPALPIGVFVTPEDSEALAAATPGFSWTARVIVGKGDPVVGLALTQPSDVFEALYSSSLMNVSGSGKLKRSVTVVFELPPLQSASPSGFVPAKPEHFVGSFGDVSNCARWTLKDGTEHSVAPVIDDLPESRVRAICAIPAIGDFSSLQVGMDVTTSAKLSPPTIAGRSSAVIVGLAQPITAASDSTNVDVGAAPQTLRTVVENLSDGQFWGMGSHSGEGGLPYLQFDELKPGGFSQILLVDEDAYSWISTWIQVAWVATGLAGGWVALASYRFVGLLIRRQTSAP